jgi:hypothetical protein
VIVVELPGRALIFFDGPDDVEVELDPDIDGPLTLAGARGVRRSDELRRALEAEVRRVLSRPAYRRDAFDDDGDFRLLPGTASHARAALLSLDPKAVIVEDDEDDVEAALREFDRR